MKNIFIAIAVLTTFAACRGNKSDLDTTKQMVTLNDSALYNGSYLSDTGRMTMPAPAVVAPPRYSTNAGTAPKRTSGSSTRKTSGVSKSSGTSSSSGTTASTPAKPKGWSKAAKGAAIGGVGGAVAGAVITKSGKGAIIGGVIGAAGGYILGRSKDKKDGRVQ